jgi:hypothetical protein
MAVRVAPSAITRMQFDRHARGAGYQAVSVETWAVGERILDAWERKKRDALALPGVFFGTGDTPAVLRHSAN